MRRIRHGGVVLTCLVLCSARAVAEDAPSEPQGGAGAAPVASEPVVGPGAPSGRELRLKRGWVQVEEQLDLRPADARTLEARAAVERGADEYGPVVAEDGSVQFEYGAAIPKLFCRPLTTCDIALQPGESVAQIEVGTGEHGPWMVRLVTGQFGVRTRRPHVVVRPKKTRVKTNLTIWTDRRTYHLDLIPSEKPLRYVSFSYPQDELQASIAAGAAATAQGGPGAGEGVGGPFSGRPWEWRSNYEVECVSRWRVCRRIKSWMKPELVLDDGNQTQITLPEEVLSRDRPVLHLISPSGQRIATDYTVHGRTYMVPATFEEASLILRYGKRRRHRLEYRIRRVEED